MMVVLASEVQCEQGWDNDDWGNCYAGLLRQVVVLGMQLVLDWGVPANGLLVLWTHVGVDHEGLPNNGRSQPIGRGVKRDRGEHTWGEC